MRPTGYILGYFSEATGWAEKGVQCLLVGLLLNCSNFGSLNLGFFWGALYTQLVKLGGKKEGIDPENECVAQLDSFSSFIPHCPTTPKSYLATDPFD